jgi:GTPase SAR1 family protein
MVQSVTITSEYLQQQGFETSGELFVITDTLVYDVTDFVMYCHHRESDDLITYWYEILYENEMDDFYVLVTGLELPIH